jgi:pimeloyl-ACP methyl ester carboxylesterase/uncharacterized protein YndB with AHSA1/START domain
MSKGEIMKSVLGNAAIGTTPGLAIYAAIGMLMVPSFLATATAATSNPSTGMANERLCGAAQPRQNERSNINTTAFLLAMLLPAAAVAQQKPTTGYALVNGLKMYYEVHGSGDPVVLLHGAFMTITNNWPGWIGELSKTRKVIAVEMQGHGRTADIPRDITYENLADDVAALLDHLKIPRADLIGYSMGGAVAMQCAIRHPDKVRKVVVISSWFRRDGIVKEGLDALAKLTADAFKGSPIEAEYKKLSPTPDDFPKFVKRLLATSSKGHDIGADQLKASTAPMFFIHGDADGVRLEHIAEMFRLKGGEIHGDIKPRSASRLAILPDTTHVTLMQRMPVIVPMVNDFLDAKTSANIRSATKDLVMTRVFDAPVESVWKAWSESDQVKRWWGPIGFSCPVAKMDFREGGTSLVAMRAPNGQDFYNTWSYKKIVRHERIEFVLDWADKDGNRIDPASMGLPPDMPKQVRHLITFKSIPGKKTEMTITEFGYTSDQILELSKAGLQQCLDKMAASFGNS